MALSKNGLEFLRIFLYIFAVLWVFTVTASVIATFYLSESPVIFRVEADDNMVEISRNMNNCSDLGAVDTIDMGDFT